MLVLMIDPSGTLGPCTNCAGITNLKKKKKKEKWSTSDHGESNTEIRIKHDFNAAS